MEKIENQTDEIRKERTPGEIVAARRKQLNWSQLELSIRSEVSVPQISRIECDQTRPNYETIIKLEKALGIQLVDAFMEYRKHFCPKRHRSRTHSAIKSFERDLTLLDLSPYELKTLLDRTLSDAEEQKKGKK